MPNPVVLAVGALVAAGAGAGAFFLWRNKGPLSKRRKFVLESLRAVVPSRYGDSKFARIAPGYDPDDPKLPTGFTTCGYLPCYVGRELGVPKCITQGGLEQMRINGRAMGAWVDATGGNRPSPGDLYAIETGNKLIVHVGVIENASGDTWITADAGQGIRGEPQRAEYVKRPYDPQTNTIGGPGAVYVTGKGWTLRGEPRHPAGWIDIDKVPGVKLN